MELIIKSPTHSDQAPAVVWNFDELRAEIANRTSVLAATVYSEDQIAEAKQDRANINRLSKALSAKRLELKKYYLQPYEEFERQVKELSGMCDKASAAIDQQIKTFEENEKEEKRKRIEAIYAEIVNEDWQPYAPLKRLWNDRWLNKSFSEKAIREELEAGLADVKSDVDTICLLRSAYQEEMLQRYIEGSTALESIQWGKSLQEAAEAKAAREAAREAALESEDYTVLVDPTEQSTITALITAFVKRQRDDEGVKVQAVLYNAASADHEGIISVNTKATGTGIKAGSLVYWVAGRTAAARPSESLTNRPYDGELVPELDLTQAELAAAITAGKLVFHTVGREVRVLMDVNTLTTFGAGKGEIYSDNKTVRISDTIATGIAGTFNANFLGLIPNDADGRVSLHNEICRVLDGLVAERAIEPYDRATVKIKPGIAKGSVMAELEITVVGTMTHLYMTVVLA